VGIVEDWALTNDELNEILVTRPSLRGMLMGFLAEYRLARTTFSDARIHGLQRYDDHDRTRPGDFGFTYHGTPITVSVKSIQSQSVRKVNGGYAGKAQVDASDRRRVRLPSGKRLMTTCLLVGEFDLLAVNIFEFGHRWRFAFAKNADLPRSTYRRYTPAQQKCLLATSVRVTWPLQPPFRAEPFGLLDEIVRAKRRAPRRPKSN
jgi:hypothetical protein